MDFIKNALEKTGLICIGTQDYYDEVIRSPEYEYSNQDLKKWKKERKDLGEDDEGNYHWEETIITPEGKLHQAGAYNQFTNWSTEYLIKTGDAGSGS